MNIIGLSDDRSSMKLSKLFKKKKKLKGIIFIFASTVNDWFLKLFFNALFSVKDSQEW